MQARTFYHVHRTRCGFIESLERRTLLSSISGTVFEDRNDNGVYDSSPDLGGPVTTVYIDANHNGQLDTGETTTQSGSITSGNWGVYTFTNLGPGTYTIRIVTPDGVTRRPHRRPIPARRLSR